MILAFAFLALLVCVGVPVASAMRELPKPAPVDVPSGQAVTR